MGGEEQGRCPACGGKFGPGYEVHRDDCSLGSSLAHPRNGDDQLLELLQSLRSDEASDEDEDAS